MCIRDRAENGPGTPEDEGLSYVVVDEEGKEKVLLRDVVELLGSEVIGEALWNKYHRWAMFSKFFDNAGPLPHHIHHRTEHAARVGASGKPEMYFFPSQMNNHGGEFPFTFFGFIVSGITSTGVSPVVLLPATEERFPLASRITASGSTEATTCSIS